MSRNGYTWKSSNAMRERRSRILQPTWASSPPRPTYSSRSSRCPSPCTKRFEGERGLQMLRIRKPLACGRKSHRCSRQASCRPGTPCFSHSPRWKEMARGSEKCICYASPTCVSKCQSCGCMIHTVHNPEHNNTRLKSVCM